MLQVPSCPLLLADAGISRRSMAVNLRVAADMFNLPLRDLSPSDEKAVEEEEVEEEDEGGTCTAEEKDEEEEVLVPVVLEGDEVVTSSVGCDLETGTPVEACLKCSLLPSDAEDEAPEELEADVASLFCRLSTSPSPPPCKPLAELPLDWWETSFLAFSSLTLSKLASAGMVKFCRRVRPLLDFMHSS